MNGLLCGRGKRSVWVAIMLLAALSAAALLFPHVSAAGAADEAGLRGETTLIIYADDIKREVTSIILVADSSENGSVSIMSIPVNTRAVITGADGAAAYAPIKDAYKSGGDAAESLKDAVEALLGGVKIGRVIAVSQTNLRDIIDSMGGIRLATSDIPAITVVESPGNSVTYPDDSDNDNLALWLKRQAAAQGMNADYDIDIAKMLSGTTAQQFTSTDMTTVLLSGNQVCEVLDFTIFQASRGTDILRILRMQNVFTALVEHDGGLAAADTEGFIRYDDGEPLMERLSAYGIDRVRAGMVFPSGMDRTFGDETYWVFDSVWLHDWIVKYIYLR